MFHRQRHQTEVTLVQHLLQPTKMIAAVKTGNGLRPAAFIFTKLANDCSAQASTCAAVGCGGGMTSRLKQWSIREW
jgi:hypothetical protein